MLRFTDASCRYIMLRIYPSLLHDDYSQQLDNMITPVRAYIWIRTRITVLLFLKFNPISVDYTFVGRISHFVNICPRNYRQPDKRIKGCRGTSPILSITVRRWLSIDDDAGSYETENFQGHQWAVTRGHELTENKLKELGKRAAWKKEKKSESSTSQWVQAMSCEMLIFKLRHHCCT